ncbi:hypothetical protein [Nitrosomonas sp. Is37]|uniref:hypothetical protein n=1 Tax=Nitrosomonas sp. Is37 TaxID=3080535 RepID=UPI00294AD6A3|nr:hypothetical protein [Nitrosomonas sp. Is37]MDV6344886.1 hypothetical protein [Nitrosomonas sp. Is37]
MLIQRLGSANLNIHLHCLVFEGVYRIQKGALKFHSVRTPTTEQLTSAFDCSAVRQAHCSLLTAQAERRFASAALPMSFIADSR